MLDDLDRFLYRLIMGPAPYYFAIATIILAVTVFASQLIRMVI